MQIIAPARDLEGVGTQAVVGQMEVPAGLRRLLEGTPLRIASDTGQLITLRSVRDAETTPSAVAGTVIDPATGQVVPDPYMLFAGELDVPTIKWGQNTRRLEYRITSVFERFFQVDEGLRLAPTFHRSVWPGEAGLDAVSLSLIHI